MVLIVRYLSSYAARIPFRVLYYIIFRVFMC